MKLLLVCEGSSDTAMLAHVQRLAVRAGYPEPEGAAWTDGRRLADKIHNGLEVLGDFDLLLVHRDADRAGAETRYREIASAISSVGYPGQWVGIVPVRMTEAWLLLDEMAIRNAVRNPNGRTRLALPTPALAERMANPKAAFETALLDASEKRRRRRREVQRDLPRLRRVLLENLPVGGQLEQLESWARFRDDTISALRQLNR